MIDYEDDIKELRRILGAAVSDPDTWDMFKLAKYVMKALEEAETSKRIAWRKLSNLELQLIRAEQFVAAEVAFERCNAEVASVGMFLDDALEANDKVRRMLMYVLGRRADKAKAKEEA